MKRVLIIDDDETLLYTISEVLIDEGYQVVSRMDASRILEDITVYRPNAILMDVKLPGEDGDQVAKKLKLNGHRTTIPIILISSAEDISTKQRQSGAEAYINKPFDFNHLLKVVDTYTAGL